MISPYNKYDVRSAMEDSVYVCSDDFYLDSVVTIQYKGIMGRVLSRELLEDDSNTNPLKQNA